MKATLKLDNLETTRGGTKFVNLILKMEFKRERPLATRNEKYCFIFR